MSEDKLTAEDEQIADKAFAAFLAGKIRMSSRMLSRLPDEQRLRVYRYGFHPKVKAYADALRSQYIR